MCYHIRMPIPTDPAAISPSGGAIGDLVMCKRIARGEWALFPKKGADADFYGIGRVDRPKGAYYLYSTESDMRFLHYRQGEWTDIDEELVITSRPKEFALSYFNPPISPRYLAYHDGEYVYVWRIL